METFEGHSIFMFLVADTPLYKRLCPSVCWSVGPSVGPSRIIELNCGKMFECGGGLGCGWGLDAPANPSAMLL